MFYYCDFSCNKLPVKLANFHKQALDACKLAFCHNFSPHRCILWNNQNVLRGKKSVFIKIWFDKGVIFVLELKKDGNFYSYSEFSELFEVDTSPRVYEWVINSISPKLLHLVRTNCYISLKCEILNFLIRVFLIQKLLHLILKSNNFWLIYDYFFNYFKRC